MSNDEGGMSKRGAERSSPDVGAVPPADLLRMRRISRRDAEGAEFAEEYREKISLNGATELRQRRRVEGSVLSVEQENPVGFVIGSW